jgi:hypothetical protein
MPSVPSVYNDRAALTQVNKHPAAASSADKNAETKSKWGRFLDADADDDDDGTGDDGSIVF